MSARSVGMGELLERALEEAAEVASDVTPVEIRRIEVRPHALRVIFGFPGGEDWPGTWQVRVP